MSFFPLGGDALGSDGGAVGVTTPLTINATSTPTTNFAKGVARAITSLQSPLYTLRRGAAKFLSQTSFSSLATISKVSPPVQKTFSVVMASIIGNLHPKSNPFNDVAYYTANNQTITTGQSDPHGTNKAVLLTGVAGFGSYPTTSSGNSYYNQDERRTFSVYMKPNGFNFVTMAIGGGVTVCWNLTTGSTTSTITSGAFVNNWAAAAEILSGGWIRAYITTIPSSGVSASPNFQVRDGPIGSGNYNFTANGTDGFYIYGLQINDGGMQPYVETTGSPVVANAVSVTTVKGKPLLASGTGSATVTKRMGKSLAIASTLSALMSKVFSGGSVTTPMVLNAVSNATMTVKRNGTKLVQSLVSPLASAMKSITHAVTSISTPAYSRRSQTTKLPAIAVTPSATKQSRASKTIMFSATVNGIVSRIAAMARTVLGSAQANANASKLVARLVSSLANSGPATSKSIAGTKSIATTPSATVTRLGAFYRSISSLVNVNAAVANRLSFIRSFANLSTPAPRVVRATSSTKSATSAPTLTVSKGSVFFRGISSAVAASPILLKGLAYLRNLTATNTPVGSAQRSSSKALVSVSTPTFSVAKIGTFFRAFSNSVSTTAAVAQNKFAARVIGAIIIPSANVYRGMTKVILSSVSSIQSSAKSFGHSLVATSPGNAALNRAAARTSLASTTPAPATAKSASLFRTIAASTTSAFTMVKLVTKALGIAVGTMAAISKRSLRSVSANSTPTPLLSRSVSKTSMTNVTVLPVRTNLFNRVVASTSMGVSTVAKSSQRVFGQVVAAVSASARGIIRSVVAISAPSVTGQRSVAHAVSTAVTVLPVRTNLFNRVIASTSAGVSTLAKSTQRILGQLVATMPSGNRGISRSVVSTTTPTATSQRTVVRVVSSAVTTASNVVRRTLRSLVGTAPTASSLKLASQKVIAGQADAMPAMTRLAAMRRTISGLLGTAAELTKSTSKSSSVVANTSSTMLRIPVVMRTISGATNGLASLNRSTLRLFEAVVGSTADTRRSVARSVTSVVGSVSAISRALSRLISLPVSAVSSRTGRVGKTANAISTTAPSSARANAKAVSAQSTPAAQMSRSASMRRVMSALIDSVTSLTKSATKSASGTASTNAVTTRVPVVMRTFGQLANAVASSAKSNAKTVVANVDAVLTTDRAIARVIAALGTGFTALSKSMDRRQSAQSAVATSVTKSLDRTTDIVSPVTAVVTRAAARNRVIGALANAAGSASRQSVRVLSSASGIAATLSKSSARMVQSTANTVSNLTPTKVILRLVNGTVGTAASAQRSVQKRLSAAASVVSSAVKGLRYTIDATSDGVAAASRRQAVTVIAGVGVEALTDTLFIAVEVVDPQPYVEGKASGGQIGGYRRGQTNERMLVRYKGKIIHYDPATDKDKKLVNIQMRIGGELVRHMMLVDAQKVPLVISCANWASQSAEKVSVTVKNLTEAARNISVKVGQIMRPSDWWRRRD